jgi:valyl-tRNA synthetase
VLMNCENFTVAPDAKLAPKTDAEKWILTRLERMLADVEVQMPLYRFDLVAQSLYEFTWNIYCDWFLEFAKPALGSDNKEVADSTRHTLLFVLEALLRALHPIIPFITEEIWQTIAPMLGKSGASISTQSYPQSSSYTHFIDGVAEESIEWLREVLTQVRRIRSEMNIAPGKTIPLLYANGTPNQRDLSRKFNAQIAFLARAESQRWLDASESEPASASAIVGEMKILIPLAGLIDLNAEKTRLAKEIKRIEGENAKSTAKLANFGERTPATVVEQEKQRLKDFEQLLAGLREQLKRLDDA